MLDSLSFDPVFRPALIVGMAGALGGLALWHALYLRGAVGTARAAAVAVLRLAVIAGLALILMRPMRLEADKRPSVTPVFALVVDRSASMCTKDVGDTSRNEAIVQALNAARDSIERKMRQGYTLKVFEFSDQLRETTYDHLLTGGDPAGEQTDLASALIGAAEGGEGQHAGMLVISDGRVNHVAGPGGVVQAARYLRARKVPVWTVSVGKEGSRARDVYALARLNQNFVYVRQPGSIDVTIDQSGYQGWPAMVHLKREGVEVTAQQVLLADNTTQISFPITENAPGLFEYNVEVDPFPGESDLQNNKRAVFVRVTDHRTQVLLVEAEPYWDSKFMLRALRKDPNLDVTSFFQLNERKSIAIRQVQSNPDRDDADPKASPAAVRIPRTRDELFAYDVVILGRGADRIFNAEELKLFKAYLTERGGNIVFARGRAYGERSNALAEIDPLIWGVDKLSDVRFALTEKGKETFSFTEAPDATVMIKELPSMLSVTRVEKEKQLATILARTETGKPGQELAVIACQRYGKGKVLSVGSAGLWRWSLVPDEAERYQGVYEEFWSQLVRWLVAYSDFMPSQEITFESNRNAYQLGDQVRLAVRTRQIDLKQYKPQLEVKRVDGKQYKLELQADPDQGGVFTSMFIPDAEGEFVATLRNNIGQPRQDTVRFTVYQDSREKRFVAADPSLLGQVARVTGGEPLKLDELQSLPDRVRKFEQLTAERRRPVDAWDGPGIFYLLMGLAATEWLIRRLSGLV